MTRIVALNALKAGINRQRTKGGADPEALFDLENGYITLAGTIQSRPGTVQDAVLPAGTKGLCAFKGAMVVFSNTTKACPAGYSCEVLVNPVTAALAISEIHYAGPFLGYLYVVAEFSDGSVYHYWLQGSGSTASQWQANHVYGLNDVVTPGNGLSYRATRLNAADPAWKAGAPRAVGGVVEPTVFNNYKYTVVEVSGSNPRSGDAEPTWPAQDGAGIYELVDLGTGSGTITTTTIPPDTTVPADVDTRYGNMAGGGLSKPIVKVL